MSKFNIGTLVKIDSDEIALSEDAEFLSQYIGQTLKIIDVKKSESFGTIYTCEDENGTKIQHSAYTKEPIDFNFVDADFDDNVDGFFDENPEIEQITDVENDCKDLFSTTTWDVYSDHEYAKNILAENKNMASYLSQLGLTQEEISNICYGGAKNRGSIDVTFVSLWDGDTEIETPAKLDVDTGEVYSIVTQDVESYNVSILSLESIRINDIDEDFDVLRDYEDMEFAIDPGSLNKINELIKEHKVVWANEGTFHKVEVNGREFSFQLDTGAYDEPIQPFNGNVLIDDGEAQFTISANFGENQLDLIEKEVRTAIIEKYFSEDLNIRSFNGISVNSNDLLSETKSIFLDENADWTPSDVGGLIFKKETLTSFLEDDYFDDDNKPSENCIKEISNIVLKLQETNSSIMYLQ